MRVIGERPERRAGVAWLVLVVLLLFSIAAPLNQYKVPPIMPVLMQAFNVHASEAGLLMSVYALAGLVLAIPAGFIFQRAGHLLTPLIAGGSIVLGALLGALSPSVEGLLASRVIEGIGTSFMAVLAPAVVSMWFAANRRGVAMGIWANWVPLGSITTLLLAPYLAQALSWRAVWWFGAGYALVVTVLCLLFVGPPPVANGAAGVAAEAMPPLDPAATRRLLRNRNLWLLSLAFAFFCAAFVGGFSFLPTYLNEVHNIPLPQGSAWASLARVTAILAAPLAGGLSDRIGSRKIPYMLGFILSGLSLPLVLLFTGKALIGLILVQGAVTSLAPPNIFSAAIETAGDERLGGLAMGVIMVGQNAGMLVGPLLFGLLVETRGGWPLAFCGLALVGLLAALAGSLAKTSAQL